MTFTINPRALRLFRTISVCGCFALAAMQAVAQEDGQGSKVQVTGSIQSDILIPQADAKIGAEDYSEFALTNTFGEVNLSSKYIDAGARVEYLDHPLPGFEPDYKGWGLPYIYVKGKFKNVELTAGNFYEQFGSGFILRTYEERSLGIDNSLLGGRLVYKPFNWATVKVLGGKQRRYWHDGGPFEGLNDSWLAGADVELNVEQWFKRMREGNTYLTLGASFVNKHEGDQEMIVSYDGTKRLNFPENVQAFDVRARLQTGNWNILAEYARKTQDPGQDNDYTYRKGYVAMLSASYSKRGMSLLLQAKRSDNMAFRSQRTLPTMTENSSFINHLPAFTMEHTYALAARYPYATQPDGEWAYQGELAYNFKRRTPLGGKYGTKVKLNFSYVHSISKNLRFMDGIAPGINGYIPGTDGYGSAFFKWGDSRYYQDFNVQIEKKITKAFKLNLMYMNQFYNKTIVEGHGGMLHNNIYVAEGKYQFNNKFTLRAEAQYLDMTSGQNNEEGDCDCVFGLLELSVLPYLMFTVSDEYSIGDEIHYYNGSVTFAKGAHRLQVGYARTRAGMNCSGGVCRWVPATKGVTMSYNFNF